MNGIVLIHKEQNYTSFDVVAIMRKTLGIKKVGHLGTLDPMATGVLPILIGKGTKLGQYLSADKEYEAEFKFGFISDTEDIWGEIQTVDEDTPSEDKIKSACKTLIGKQFQTPPMYSAKKVNGVRLYKLARQGVEIERKPKEIEVYSIEYLGRQADGGFKIRVSCSEGTYIRTLIKEIGERAGGHAVMTALVRTKSHGFSLDKSLRLDEVRILSEKKELDKIIINMEKALSNYETLDISDENKEKFLNGVKLPLDFADKELNSKYYKIYSGNLFLGLGEVNFESAELKVALHGKEND